MYYTYILISESILEDSSNRRYYYGHCHDLTERLIRHNAGKVRSTKAYRPWSIHYFEVFQTKSEAYNREMFFKSAEGKFYSFVYAIFRSWQSD